VMLPEFARLCQESALRMRDLARNAAPLVLAFAAYAVVVSLLAKPLLHAAYGTRYDQYTVLVWLFGLTYVASAVVQVLSWLLKASGHPRSVVWVWALSAGVVIVLAVPVLHWGGLPLAIALNCLSYILAAFAAAYRIRTLKIVRTSR